MCAFGEPRVAIAAHENDGNVGPQSPDLAREFRAGEVRHCFVRQDKIETTRVRAERLQRGGAGLEPDRLITKPGQRLTLLVVAGCTHRRYCARGLRERLPASLVFDGGSICGNAWRLNRLILESACITMQALQHGDERFPFLPTYAGKNLGPSQLRQMPDFVKKRSGLTGEIEASRARPRTPRDAFSSLHDRAQRSVTLRI